MKRIIIAVLTFTLLLGCGSKEKKAFSHTLLTAPLINVDGDSLTFNNLIESHKGKKTMIEVWASWCPDCIKGLSKLNELQEKQPNMNYVFISLDKNETSWKKGIKRYRIKGDHYYVEGGWKSIFAKNIDLDWIPRYLLIDENGKIVIYRAIEANDDRITNVLKN